MFFYVKESPQAIVLFDPRMGEIATLDTGPLHAKDWCRDPWAPQVHKLSQMLREERSRGRREGLGD